MNARRDAMRIHDETAADWAAVERLNRQAFAGDFEADPIARLRGNRSIACALVAEPFGAIVGHIAFSWLAVQGGGRKVRAVAPAPLAVRPDRQGGGIGSSLVTTGLATVRAARRRSFSATLAYYRRFGLFHRARGETRSAFQRRGVHGARAGARRIGGTFRLGHLSASVRHPGRKDLRRQAGLSGR